MIDPQLAYDQIVSDSGLSCPGITVSKFADRIDGGLFNGPIYLILNKWGLSEPVRTATSEYVSLYAHHGIDMMMLTEAWGREYHPTNIDTAGAATIQKVVFNFLRSPYDMTGAFGITPFRTPADWNWPDNYSTTVINYKRGPQMQSNVKKHICDFFFEIGISDPNFWWEN